MGWLARQDSAPPCPILSRGESPKPFSCHVGPEGPEVFLAKAVESRFFLCVDAFRRFIYGC